MLAASLASWAQQQSAKIARVGFLGATTAAGYAANVEALRAGLRDLGYVEGKNVLIEFRWADGKVDRLPGLAAELVRLKPDVLVTFGTPGTLAAKRATATIPIVMAISGDAVATGIVDSLARPTGNITGSTNLNPELAAKRLGLLREAMPRISRIAAFDNPDNPINRPILQAMKTAAATMRMDLQPYEVRAPVDFDGALSSIAKAQRAVVVNDDPMLIANATALAALTSKHRVPSIGFTEFAQGGGLLGYGANRPERFRRAAYFVDRIVKGAKPHNLPIEQPTKIDLVVNMKTAKALGVMIPRSLLLHADQVIE
jgi:putative ABC transport system substrate-binding protein